MRSIVSSFLLASALCSALPGAAPIAGGPAIQVSPNGHYFVGADGRPFFWQGDTEWELFHLYSEADAAGLLRLRHEEGFNVIQVSVKPQPNWGAKGMRAADLEEAWSNGDPRTPNETYFRRVDAIVAAAARNNLVLAIQVYHGIDVDRGRIDVGSGRAWARWLGLRYRNAGNIVWSMAPHATGESVPMLRAVVEGLREADGGAHLITIHPDPAPYPLDFMNSEPWLAFNTLQTWSTNYSANYEDVLADYQRTPRRPVVDGEARYEGEDGTSPLETRRVGYWACLAGGFYSYGHRDSWTAPWKWREFAPSPGAWQLKILGDLFRSLDWWTLVPDSSLLIDAGRRGNVAARSSSGSWILAYLPLAGPATLRLDALAAAKAECWWIDPQTGTRIRIGVFPTGQPQDFSAPPAWQDAVFLARPRQ
jgi:hypothetical protein